MNFQKMTEMLKKNQREMEKKLSDFEQKQFDFDYKNGAIKIFILGNLKIKKIEINKTLIDPDDKIMLEEMLVEAVNEATTKIESERNNIAEQSMPKIPGLF